MCFHMLPTLMSDQGIYTVTVILIWWNNIIVSERPIHWNGLFLAVSFSQFTEGQDDQLNNLHWSWNTGTGQQRLKVPQTPFSGPAHCVSGLEGLEEQTGLFVKRLFSGVLCPLRLFLSRPKHRSNTACFRPTGILIPQNESGLFFLSIQVSFSLFSSSPDTSSHLRDVSFGSA